MSAETIPAEVLALARKVVADIAAGAGMPRRADAVMIGDMDGGPEVKAAIHAILADRSTRPAESAPEVEVGDGETYYTKGKDADWFEGLSDKDAAWALTCAAMDLNDTGMGDQADRFMPHNAMLSGAGDRIKALLSTLEAERARADAAVAALLEETGCTSLDDLRDKAAIGASLMERIADLCKPGSRHEHWAPADDPAEIVFDLANEADELRRERDEARSYGQAVRIEQNRLESEVAHWKDRAARALQDREEAVRVAVEDERDRLYALAEEKDAELRAFGPVAASNLLRRQGAMLPADRARLRADQRAGDGGEA